MLKELEKQYSPWENLPLGWYAAVALGFNGLLFAALKSSPAPSRQPSVFSRCLDLLTMGAATHKLARIITKDEITSFARAPFTRYEEPLGYGEVNETARRSGLFRVIGELVSCNYCMSAWVGLGFAWGLPRYPEKTRKIAAFFTWLALADFMHVAYEEKRTRANVLTLREESMDKNRKKAS